MGYRIGNRILLRVCADHFGDGQRMANLVLGMAVVESPWQMLVVEIPVVVKARGESGEWECIWLCSC